MRDSGLLGEDSGPEGGAGPGVGCARFKSIIIYFFVLFLHRTDFYFLAIFCTFSQLLN